MPDPGQETEQANQDASSQVANAQASQDGAAKISTGLAEKSASEGKATADAQATDGKTPPESKDKEGGEQKPTITPELQKIIDNAIQAGITKESARFQSIADTQVAAANKRAKDAEEKAAQVELDGKIRQVKENLGDTPEATQRISDLTERARLDRERRDEKATLEARENLAAEGIKARDALALAEELQVDVQELIKANVGNKAEMHAFAVELQRKTLAEENEKLKAKIAEIEKKPVKSAGAGNAASGPNLKDMKPAEKIRYGIEHPETSKNYSKPEYTE